MTDRSDMVFYAAIATLPVDGTVAGIYQPLWNPISPWLFIAYAILNIRRITPIIRHEWSGLHRTGLTSSSPVLLPWLCLPAALIALSMFGWVTIDVHPTAIFQTLSALAGALACLLSLYIAISCKHLSSRSIITILAGAYACALFVGVIQFIGIHAGATSIIDYFSHLMAREYISGTGLWKGSGPRPQFLFAEPSYIGMHMFGVLLPAYWITKDRRLPPLIVAFVAGSLIMGSGVRIIPDTLIACAILVIMATDWHDRRSALRTGALFALLAATALVFIAANPRLRAIASQGALLGDDSTSSRIMQTLIPAAAAIRSWPHLLFGFGAGNMIDVYRAGKGTAAHWYQEITGGQSFNFGWLGNFTHTSREMFTMSAYTSFIAEFGLAGFALLAFTLIRHVTICHAWNKRNIWWLLLIAYLYVQFEGYAFYALPLFIWVTANPRIGDSNTDERNADNW